MRSEPRMLAPHLQSPSATPDESKVVPLPTEIYESILDELAESPETLCACALVCHLFAQRAQKLLFSCISLTRPTKVFKAALGIRSYVWPSMRFLQIISSSPHLAGYVKTLGVSDEAPLQFYREERSWIRSDNTVHQILPRLANLEELRLEGNPRGIGLNFRKWGDGLRAGILERCSSERLVTIHLAHLRNVPRNLLVLAPRLETLGLKKVLFVPEFDRYTVGEVFDLQQYTTPKERVPPARLKHVSVTWMRCEEWRTFYPWLASHLDLTHIKLLLLHVDFENAPEETVEEGLQAISNLFRGCSATLETLRFSMPEQTTATNLRNQPHPFELDVRMMPALRDLDINSSIWDERQYLAVSGIHPTPSVAQPPKTALRTLSSIISQMLPFKTHGGEHDGSSSSGSPHWQLETLTLLLTIDFFEEPTSSKLENIGWEEFIRVVEALAGVGRMSLELEREAMRSDTRPLEEWETTSESGRSFMPRSGATSVTIIVSAPGMGDEPVADLLREKLRRLQDKGVGLTIHFTQC